MVRTPGFHPGNPGSIPGEITKINNPSSDELFILTLSAWEFDPEGSNSVKSIDFTEFS